MVAGGEIYVTDCDARRRGMNYVLWMLLALLIPGAVGIILCFILRDPLPVPCPSCGTLATKGHAFCSACGAPVRVACPQCREPPKPEPLEPQALARTPLTP